MPVVFRRDGFKFFFYSNEGDPREPPHVHVRKGEGSAKFWIDPPVPCASFGFDAKTLRALNRMIEDRGPDIERACNDCFG
jgi:hypothetical protein